MGKVKQGSSYVVLKWRRQTDPDFDARETDDEDKI